MPISARALRSRGPNKHFAAVHGSHSGNYCLAQVVELRPLSERSWNETVGGPGLPELCSAKLAKEG
jgi:hypothetical protein